MTSALSSGVRIRFGIFGCDVDALHLATMHFIREGGESVRLASYDDRLIAAAQALGIALAIQVTPPFSH